MTAAIGSIRALLVILCASVWAWPAMAQEESSEGGLVPFSSEAELDDFLREVQEANAPAPQGTYESGDGYELEEIVTTANRAAPDSITNSQHKGVDEGGIVKQSGDHLVILRRGRLFTVDIAGPTLRRRASINAFAPGIDPDGAWYDEMLISREKVVVIGYSYDFDATEIGIFNISANGSLRHRATYHVRSYDYYSSRNYASRLIDNKLILYAPMSFGGRGQDSSEFLPGMSKWRAPTDETEDAEPAFKPIISPQNIYRGKVSIKRGKIPVLHTVTVCNLGSRELDCKASGVVGEWGRVFYVSPKAMYVWASNEVPEGSSEATGTLFRMPLDGSPPQALGVWGSPIDQFSFEETPDGFLNVLVESDFDGDGMWDAEEVLEGDVALLRLPLSAFTDGTTEVPRSAYRALPRPSEDGVVHNRFVGEYLLYGSGEGWFDGEVPASTVFAVHVKTGKVSQFALPHGVDRLEALGSNALVVGASDEDLHFTGIRLRKTPALAQRYVLANASEGETRSHGFFYSEDRRGDGVLGLPIRSPADPGYAHLFDESAAIIYLRSKPSQFLALGKLHARDAEAQDDGCQASCVDWYGNARPIFLDGRIFALLGYELVEGQARRGRIREVRRVDFTPRVMTAARH